MVENKVFQILYTILLNTHVFNKQVSGVKFGPGGDFSAWRNLILKLQEVGLYKAGFPQQIFKKVNRLHCIFPSTGVTTIPSIARINEDILPLRNKSTHDCELSELRMFFYLGARSFLYNIEETK